MEGQERYRSFGEFYPFYIAEHQNRTSRRLHVVGTGLVIATAVSALAGKPRRAFAIPFIGYGFAWVGHYFFEHNRPATFTYPRWSLMGDFRLFYETVTGKRAW